MSRSPAVDMRLQPPLSAATGTHRTIAAQSQSQRGAALLMAMLTVTLVATFAAAALWQQWRAAEVESAERARVQSAWVLVGALDWSRLILREDARAGGIDSLSEPWAVPLEEARLTSFLSADKNIASDALEGLPDAFLSGRIVDAQSRLNVTNLVANGKPVASQVAAFNKLFALLGLPGGEVAALTSNLQRAMPATATPPVGTPVATPGTGTGTPPIVGSAGGAAAGVAPSLGGEPGAAADPAAAAEGPLMPQQTAQLVWLGLSPESVAAIEPYVTVLPVPTPLNINTASAEALYASAPALDLAGAQRLVAQRARSAFRTLADANAQLPDGATPFVDGQHSVSTRFFDVLGRLRLDQIWVEEHSLLRRDGINVSAVWRERGAGASAVAAQP